LFNIFRLLAVLSVFFLIIFAITLVIVLIFKVVKYLNGEKVLTEKKLSRKLLGAELGVALACFVLYWLNIWI